MLAGNGLALDLENGGDGHGDSGEDEADADALQVGDAGGDAGEFSDERYDDSVVERDDDDQEGDREDREGGRGDFEVGVYGFVHGLGLLDGECLELSEAESHDDCAAEDRDHPVKGLGVFDLSYSAESPWIWRRSFWLVGNVGDYCCFV